MSENSLTNATITVRRTTETNIQVTGLSNQESEENIQAWISGILNGIDPYGDTRPYSYTNSRSYDDTGFVDYELDQDAIARQFAHC